MATLQLSQRLTKCMLLMSCALLLTLVFIDNMTAYDINYEYIKHIMSMDTTFKHPSIYWRAVNNPIFYHICFALIIIYEGIASILMWLGVCALFKNLKRDSVQFQSAKQWGLVGLASTIVLYSFVFITIASQWFASWQSSTWNAKNAAIPFIMLFGITYLVLASKDR